MVKGVDRVAELDRAAVRRLAVERFDVSRMVDDYLRVYENAQQAPRA